MIDFILAEFTKICKKAIEKFSNELQKPKEDVAITFNLNQDNEVIYRLLKDFKFEKEVTFMEILGVRIDFKGYSMLVPPFIQKSLIGFCDEYKIEPSKVNVMVLLVQEKICLVLFNDTEQVKQIKLDDLLKT
jgi:hypothetical protein